MAKKLIKVAAPRKTPWNPADPQSLIVCMSRGRLHPENPAHKMPPGEICICEGEGVKGDPSSDSNPKVAEPWVVHPYPDIIAKLREGVLVEVEDAETADLQMDEDSLNTLSLGPRAVKGLIERRVEGVSDLADKLARADDPIGWLEGVKGIGKATAIDLLDQLEARGFLEAAE